MTIKLAIVDDQPLIREGIASLISISNIAEVMWQAADGEQALERLEQVAVDLILSDIKMPGMDGISLLKKMRQRGDNTPVLLLTTFQEHQLFIDALQAGANGFLLKDISLEKLKYAIEIVANGGSIAEPQFLRSREKYFSDNTQLQTLDVDNKDLQILRYIAAGFNNKEISDAIHLAPGTVKNRISIILEKLDCRDRTQAVIKSIQLKII